jgi:pyruvate,water dikinase
VRPRNWIGTATPSQLAFPYLVNWGYPERFQQAESADELRITGIAGSPGVVEGTARVVRTVDEFDDVADGDILVCQMTNPAWVVLFTKIAALVTAAEPGISIGASKLLRSTSHWRTHSSSRAWRTQARSVSTTMSSPRRQD